MRALPVRFTDLRKIQLYSASSRAGNSRKIVEMPF